MLAPLLGKASERFMLLSGQTPQLGQGGEILVLSARSVLFKARPGEGRKRL